MKDARSHGRALLAAVSIATALLLSACGDDDGTASDAGASSTTTTSEATPTGDAAVDAAVVVYDSYVEENAASLVDATNGFVAAIEAGDLELAKELYPQARVFFERIEPVAGAFGSLDPEIDAREGDVPKEDWPGIGEGGFAGEALLA